MTSQELRDNLAFLSALQVLKRLVERDVLTEEDGAAVRAALKRKLRPTV